MKLTHTTVARLGITCLFGLAPLSIASAQSGDKGRSAAAPSPIYSVQLPGEATAETALDGFCPVCIVAGKGWVPGDERFATIVDNKRYLFPDAQVKAIFDADPAKFIPAAGGDCIVCHAEKGMSVPGSVRHAATFEGRLYLFPSDKEKQVFLANPTKYATADLAYDGDCAVCHVEMNKRMAGNAEHTAIYQGKRYQFPSDKERQLFLKDPMKYAEPTRG